MCGISTLFTTVVSSADISEHNQSLLSGEISGYKVPDGIISPTLLDGIVHCLNHNHDGVNISTMNSDDGGIIVHSMG